MGVAYIASAHNPLAGLNHKVPTSHRGGWERLSRCGPRVEGTASQFLLWTSISQLPVGLKKGPVLCGTILFMANWLH